MEKYHLSLRDFAEGRGEICAGLREQVVTRFEKCRSSELPEDMTWSVAIEHVLMEFLERKDAEINPVVAEWNC